jgi:ABC-type Fe3+-hydroxamate transport system substrate-binding protein
VKADVVASLRPDLIIANKEENVRDQIEQLENIAAVWISDVSNLDDALDMIEQVGAITNRNHKAQLITQKIKTSFSLLLSPGERLGMRVCYLIWKNPYMSIGSDTFIHDMLGRGGFENVFAQCSRYPEVSPNQIKAAGCNLIFLSSEPYPFKQRHAEELEALLPDCHVRLVDGEMFSWYGSRLILAADYFQTLINEIALEIKKL